MKSKLFAALLIAASASTAAPAFASGYGPAPFYRPSVGAPASQRGPSDQTVAVEQGGTSASVNDAYGGVVDTTSQSGSGQLAESTRSVYTGH